jgi:hypothetical protein
MGYVAVGGVLRFFAAVYGYTGKKSVIGRAVRCSMRGTWWMVVWECLVLNWSEVVDIFLQRAYTLGGEDQRCWQYKVSFWPDLYF